VKYRLKHIAEYAALRGVAWLLWALPYRAALLLAWILARLAFHVVRFRRKQAAERIREVFGEGLPDRRVREISWVSWRNFVFGAVDLVRLPHMSREWLVARIEDCEKAGSVVLAHCATGQGGIQASPHIGSWELGGVAMQKIGVPIFFITGRQKNPLVDRYLNRLRGATGIATVERGSSLLKGVIRRLKGGGILAFLPDVRSPAEEIRIRFLGKEANVPAGMALFARQAMVPIFPTVITRTGWTRHRLAVGPAVRPDPSREKHEDWQRMTQEVFDYCEKEILAQPEQWFWYNKRWILDPVPREPARPSSPESPARSQ
jgi:lauroyl/myristoyl acyltransferase